VRAYLWVLYAEQFGRYVTGSEVPEVDTVPETLNLHQRRLKLGYNTFVFMCAHTVYILCLSPSPNVVILNP